MLPTEGRGKRRREGERGEREIRLSVSLENLLEKQRSVISSAQLVLRVSS